MIISGKALLIRIDYSCLQNFFMIIYRQDFQALEALWKDYLGAERTIYEGKKYIIFAKELLARLHNDADDSLSQHNNFRIHAPALISSTICQLSCFFSLEVGGVQSDLMAYLNSTPSKTKKLEDVKVTVNSALFELDGIGLEQFTSPDNTDHDDKSGGDRSINKASLDEFVGNRGRSSSGGGSGHGRTDKGRALSQTDPVVNEDMPRVASIKAMEYIVHLLHVLCALCKWQSANNLSIKQYELLLPHLMTEIGNALECNLDRYIEGWTRTSEMINSAIGKASNPAQAAAAHDTLPVQSICDHVQQHAADDLSVYTVALLSGLLASISTASGISTATAAAASGKGTGAGGSGASAAAGGGGGAGFHRSSSARYSGSTNNAGQRRSSSSHMPFTSSHATAWSAGNAEEEEEDGALNFLPSLPWRWGDHQQLCVPIFPDEVIVSCEQHDSAGFEASGDDAPAVREDAEEQQPLSEPAPPGGESSGIVGTNEHSQAGAYASLVKSAFPNTAESHLVASQSQSPALGQGSSSPGHTSSCSTHHALHAHVRSFNFGSGGGSGGGSGSMNSGSSGCVGCAGDFTKESGKLSADKVLVQELICCESVKLLVGLLKKLFRFSEVLGKIYYDCKLQAKNGQDAAAASAATTTAATAAATTTAAKEGQPNPLVDPPELPSDPEGSPDGISFRWKQACQVRKLIISLMNHCVHSLTAYLHAQPACIKQFRLCEGPSTNFTALSMADLFSAEVLSAPASSTPVTGEQQSYCRYDAPLLLSERDHDYVDDIDAQLILKRSVLLMLCQFECVGASVKTFQSVSQSVTDMQFTIRELIHTLRWLHRRCEGELSTFIKLSSSLASMDALVDLNSLSIKCKCPLALRTNLPSTDLYPWKTGRGTAAMHFNAMTAASTTEESSCTALTSLFRFYWEERRNSFPSHVSQLFQPSKSFIYGFLDDEFSCEPDPPKPPPQKQQQKQKKSQQSQSQSTGQTRPRQNTTRPATRRESVTSNSFIRHIARLPSAVLLRHLFAVLHSLTWAYGQYSLPDDMLIFKEILKVCKEQIERNDMDEEDGLLVQIMYMLFLARSIKTWPKKIIQTCRSHNIWKMMLHLSRISDTDTSKRTFSMLGANQFMTIRSSSCQGGGTDDAKGGSKAAGATAAYGYDGSFEAEDDKDFSYEVVWTLNPADVRATSPALLPGSSTHHHGASASSAASPTAVGGGGSCGISGSPHSEDGGNGVESYVGIDALHDSDAVPAEAGGLERHSSRVAQVASNSQDSAEHGGGNRDGAMQPSLLHDEGGEEQSGASMSLPDEEASAGDSSVFGGSVGNMSYSYLSSPPRSRPQSLHFFEGQKRGGGAGSGGNRGVTGSIDDAETETNCGVYADAPAGGGGSDDVGAGSVGAGERGNAARSGVVEQEKKISFILFIQHYLVKDMVMELLRICCQYSYLEHASEDSSLDSKLFFEYEAAALIDTLSYDISDDSMILILRWLSDLADFHNHLYIKSGVWSNAVKKCASLSKNLLDSLNHFSNSSAAAAGGSILQQRPLFWPIRAAAVQLISKVAYSSTSRDWIDAFIPKVKLGGGGGGSALPASATSAEQSALKASQSSMVNPASIASSPRAGAFISDKLASLSPPDQRHTLGRMSEQSLIASAYAQAMSGKAVRHSVLVRLILDPLCRNYAISIITKILQTCAEAMHSLPADPTPAATPATTPIPASKKSATADAGTTGGGGTTSGRSLSNDGSGIFLITKRSMIEALAHDIIKGLLNAIVTAPQQPETNDGYGGIILSLEAFLILLRNPASLGALTAPTFPSSCYQQLFMNYGTVTQSHRAFGWHHSRYNFFRDLLASLSTFFKKSHRWPAARKTEVMNYGCAVMTALMIENNATKRVFQQMMMQKTRRRLSSMQILVNVCSTYSYHDLIIMILGGTDTGAPARGVSFNSILIFVGMLLDGLPTQFRAERLSGLLDGSTAFPKEGLFTDLSEVPSIANLAAVPLLLNLTCYLQPALQECILATLHALLGGESSACLVNLAKCAQMQPPLLDTILDVFPCLASEAHAVAVKLLQVVGKQVVNVAQLKRIFRLLQPPRFRNTGVGALEVDPTSCGAPEVGGDDCDPSHHCDPPSYTTHLLDAMEGMIQREPVPRHFLFFQGANSGLRLPSFKRWPAPKGFTFSTWFCIDAPNLAGLQQQSQQSTQDHRLSPHGGTDRNSSRSQLVSTEERYAPRLVSVRQDSGVGFEVLFKPVDRSFAAFKVFYTVYTGLKTCQTVEVGEVGRSQARGIGWHHLAIAHTASGFRSKSEILCMLDGNASTHTITFPRFSEEVRYPIIGDVSPAFRQEDVLATLCGQMSTVHFFSESVADSYLLGIYELGPSYTQLFSDKDALVPGEEDGSGGAVSPRRMKVRDGYLTSVLMLAYNPGVRRGRIIIDNTPEKSVSMWRPSQSAGDMIGEMDAAAAAAGPDNTAPSAPRASDAGWTIADMGGVDNGSASDPYRRMHALQLPGTHVCSQRDMRDSIDCLGGVKVLLPLFSHLRPSELLVRSRPTSSSSYSFSATTGTSTPPSSSYPSSSLLAAAIANHGRGTLLPATDGNFHTPPRGASSTAARLFIETEIMSPDAAGGARGGGVENNTFIDDSSEALRNSRKVYMKTLQLYFSFLRSTPQNVQSMNELGLSLLSYFMDSLGPVYLTEGLLGELLQRCDHLAWNEDWQDEFVREILCNFKLWRFTSFSVQEILFDYLQKYVFANVDRAHETISVRRLLDTLYTLYTTSYKQRISTQRVKLEESASVKMWDSCCTPLSPHQLKTLRASLMHIVTIVLSRTASAIHGDIHALLCYALYESNPMYRVEILQVLLQLLSPEKPDMGRKVLLGLIMHNGMQYLMSLVSDSRAKVRLYALICICSVLQFAVVHCRLPVPVITVASPQSAASTATNATDRTFTPNRAGPGSASDSAAGGSAFFYSDDAFGSSHHGTPDHSITSTPSRLFTPQRGKGKQQQASLRQSAPTVTFDHSTSFEGGESKEGDIGGGGGGGGGSGGGGGGGGSIGGGGSGRLASGLDIFERLGIPIKTLPNLMLWLQSTLKAHMKSNSIEKSTIDRQCCIIFTAMHLTMFGLSSKFLLVEVEKIKLARISSTDDPLTSPARRSRTEGPSPSRGTAKEAEFDFNRSDSADPDGKWDSEFNDHFEISETLSGRICYPMMIPAMIELLQHEAISSWVKLRLVLRLRNCFSLFENADILASVPGWQYYVFNLLVSEQTRLSVLHAQLQNAKRSSLTRAAGAPNRSSRAISSPVATAKDTSFAHAASSNSSSSSTAGSRPLYGGMEGSGGGGGGGGAMAILEEDMNHCESIVAIVIALITDMSIHAVLFGVSTTGAALVIRPGSALDIKYTAISAKELMEIIRKENRKVGCSGEQLERD